jgi:hypothetical protein
MENFKDYINFDYPKTKFGFNSYFFMIIKKESDTLILKFTENEIHILINDYEILAKIIKQILFLRKNILVYWTKEKDLEKLNDPFGIFLI